MSAAATAELASQAFDVLTACSHPHLPPHDENREILKELPDATLRAMIDRLPRLGQVDGWFIAEMIMKALYRVHPQHHGVETRSAAVAEIANVLAFAPEVLALRSVVRAKTVYVLRRALSLYEEMLHAAGVPCPSGSDGSRPDYLHAGSEDRDDVAAFVLAVHLTYLAAVSPDLDWAQLHVLEHSAEAPDPGLLAFVRRHIDNPRRVLETAVQRRTTDIEMLGALLDSDTSPIAEGAL